MLHHVLAWIHFDLLLEMQLYMRCSRRSLSFNICKKVLAARLHPNGQFGCRHAISRNNHDWLNEFMSPAKVGRNRVKGKLNLMAQIPSYDNLCCLTSYLLFYYVFTNFFLLCPLHLVSKQKLYKTTLLVCNHIYILSPEREESMKCVTLWGHLVGAHKEKHLFLFQQKDLFLAPVDKIWLFGKRIVQNFTS